MGFRNKIISVVFAVLICTSAVTITAYATGTGSDVVDDNPGEGEVVVTDPYVTDDPYAGEETYAPDEPVTDAPYIETDPYYEPETEAPYHEPTDSYYAPEVPEHTTYPYAQYENPNANGNHSGNQNTYDASNKTMATAALYDSNREISDDELSKKDWNEIAANLAKASSNTDDDDGGDFSFIKKNDSRADNGEWILIVGIALVLLSIAGISYTVVSVVKNRNSTAVYSSNKNRAVTSAVRSKFDTAEVKLPKRASRSGGKRFK